MADNGRRVFFDTEVGVHYVTHMYTLAHAGFSDDERVSLLPSLEVVLGTPQGMFYLLFGVLF